MSSFSYYTSTSIASGSNVLVSDASFVSMEMEEQRIVCLLSAADFEHGEEDMQPWTLEEQGETRMEQSTSAPSAAQPFEESKGSYLSQHAAELAALSDRWFAQQSEYGMPFEMGYRWLKVDYMKDEGKVEDDLAWLAKSHSAFKVEAARRKRVMREARLAAMGPGACEEDLEDEEEFEEEVHYEEEEQCEEEVSYETEEEYEEEEQCEEVEQQQQQQSEEDATNMMDVDEAVSEEQQLDEVVSHQEEEVLVEAVEEPVESKQQEQEMQQQEQEMQQRAEILIEELTVGFNAERMLVEMVTVLAQEKEEQREVEEAEEPVRIPRSEEQEKKEQEQDARKLNSTLRRSSRQRKPAQPRAAPYQSLRTLG